MGGLRQVERGHLMPTKMIVLILCCGIAGGYVMLHKSASPAQPAMEVASTEAAAQPAAVPSAVSVNTQPNLAANPTLPDPATQLKLSEVRAAVTRAFGK